MRIRKSQVLFPSSSLSDPHHINRSPVVVQLGDAAPPTAPKSSLLHHAAAAPSSLNRYQPSDQPLPPIGKPSNGSDDPSGESGAHRQHNKQDPLDEDVRKKDIGDSGEKGNHTRKGSNFALEMHAEVFPQSTQDERWCEGEKAIPLKKRRGSFENGSRCSRVNGRGWRCCQQTLVGYSLCEHHLGKGRLRSMTSVRSRSIATSIAPKKVLDASLSLSVPSASSSSLDKQNNKSENDEKKPVIITKKRMKLGMVKARSISSLLGQPNTQVVVSEESNN
ncbi:WRC domain [Sesbania bispinosa]|nr:WRC domain [Sesbania bispinosa]